MIHMTRLYSDPPVTKESATTRQFYKGRTDVIRCCTNDALTFVKTMVNPAATVSVLIISLSLLGFTVEPLNRGRIGIIILFLSFIEMLSSFRGFQSI